MKPRTASYSLLAFVAFLSMASEVSAQSPRTPVPEATETSRGLATGAGLRASATGTAALAYNPANLALARVYHIEAGTMYDPNYRRVALSASVADSISNQLSGGVSFRGIITDGNVGHDGYDVRWGLAFPVIEALSIGIAGRYARFSRVGSGAGNGTLVDGVTLDVALRVTPFAGLNIAAIGTNLIDLGSALTPRLIGGSLTYTIEEEVTVGADVFTDLSSNVVGAPVTAGGGLEWLVGGHVPLRGGYSFDQFRNLHTVTAGVGYVDPSFGVDLSLRQQVSGGSDTTLMLSARYFVQ